MDPALLDEVAPVLLEAQRARLLGPQGDELGGELFAKPVVHVWPIGFEHVWPIGFGGRPDVAFQTMSANHIDEIDNGDEEVEGEEVAKVDEVDEFAEVDEVYEVEHRALDEAAGQKDWEYSTNINEDTAAAAVSWF